MGNVENDKEEEVPLINPQWALGYLCSLTAQGNLDRLRNRFESHGIELPQAQFIILINLYHEDALTQQELSKRCIVDKSATKRTIDNLIVRGLVEKRLECRVNCRGGSRCYRIFLTDEAKRLRSSILGLAWEQNRELRNLLGNEEYESLCLNLVKVLKFFGKMPDIKS